MSWFDDNEDYIFGFANHEDWDDTWDDYRYRNVPRRGTKSHYLHIARQINDSDFEDFTKDDTVR